MTGRTVDKFFKFQIDDSGGTVRDIEVSSVTAVGVTYDQESLTALADALNGFKSGHGDVTLAISGPLSNLVVASASGSGAAADYSGSHVVLAPLNGGYTPLTFGCYFGIQRLWTTNDPCFGITSSATSGITVFDYTVDPSTMMYTATLKMYPGSSEPTWETTAFT